MAVLAHDCSCRGGDPSMMLVLGLFLKLSSHDHFAILLIAVSTLRTGFIKIFHLLFVVAHSLRVINDDN
jgi:hypothetical protein